ncbi:MAG: hypothetical protein ABW078_16800 [Sedimenticola sp.]
MEKGLLQSNNPGGLPGLRNGSEFFTCPFWTSSLSWLFSLSFPSFPSRIQLASATGGLIPKNT